MNDEINNSRTPQQMREALAAKIPEAFASRKKPLWALSKKRRDKLLRNWEKLYSSVFAETVQPLVYHEKRDDIPFDVLVSIEAMEPYFWVRNDDPVAYHYILPAYLRGMLLTSKVKDVAFDIWLHSLLPFDSRNEIRFSGELYDIDEQILRERLSDRSRRLEQFTPEERAFIAEFFRNFAAMFPGEDLSRHEKTLSIAENFWDGIYWKQDSTPDEGE